MKTVSYDTRIFAVAGDHAYSYEVMRAFLHESAPKHPNCAIRLVSPRNGVAFCGYVPSEWHGETVDYIPAGGFLTKPIRWPLPAMEDKL